MKARNPRSEGQLTPPSRVKAFQAAVNAWAERTGLPLAYVHMGTTGDWSLEDDDDDGMYADGVVGLVTAHVSGLAGETVAVKVEKSALDPALYARIPAELWTELETEFGVKFGRSEDCGGDTLERIDEPGVYLAPAGWTIASLYRASTEYSLEYERGEPECERATSVSTEDTVVGKRLDTEALRAADGELLLWTIYC